MYRKFRSIEAVFAAPSEPNKASIIGKLHLKPGAQLLGPSSVVMEGPGGGVTDKYTIKFVVSETKDEVDTVKHEFVLVSDLDSFEHPGAATLICDLRNGSYIFLVSRPEHPVTLVPALDCPTVTSRLAPLA